MENYGINRPLRGWEAKGHPVLRALANFDYRLLSDFVDLAFAEVRQKYGECGAMAVKLAPEEEYPTIRPVYIQGLSMGFDVSSTHNLFKDYAHVIGVRDSLQGLAPNIRRELERLVEIFGEGVDLRKGLSPGVLMALEELVKDF